MSMGRVRWVRVVLAISLLLLVSGALIVTWMPRWIDATRIRVALCKQITESTGLEASLAHVEIKPWKGFEILGRSLSLRQKGQEDPILVVPLIRARFGLMEILRGEVAVYSLELDGPELLWDGSSIAGDKKAYDPKGMVALLAMVPEIAFSNGTLRWQDEKALLRSFNGTLSSSSDNEGFFLQWSAELWGEASRVGKLSGRGIFPPDGDAWLLIEGHELLFPAVHEIVDRRKGSFRVDGKGDLRLQIKGSPTNGRFDGTWEASDLELVWPEVLGRPFHSPRSQVSFEGRWSGSSWALEDLRIETKDINLEGEISGDESGLRGLLKSGSFEFHDVIPYLGQGLIGEELRDFLREDVRSGQGREASFYFSWARHREESEQGFRLRMELDFREASLIFDPDLPPLKHLQGVLFWEEDRVWFEKLQGTYVGHAFHSMAAQITEIGRVSLFEGAFVIDLKPLELVELFSRVSPEGRFPPIGSDMEGQCALDLSLKKAFLDNRPLDYQANVKIGHVLGTLPYAPWKWQAFNGEIEITPQRISILDFGGEVENSPLMFRGLVADWASENPQLMFSGNVEVAGKDLDRIVSWTLRGLQVTKGAPASMDFSIEGELQQPEVAISWDLTPLAMQYSAFWEKPSGMQLAVDALVQRVRQGVWRLIHGTVTDEGGEIHVEGWWEGGAGQQNWLHVQTTGYSIDELSEQTALLHGKVRGGKLDLQGEIYHGEESHWMATLHPHHVVISDELAGHEVRIRSGSMVLTGEWSEVDLLEVEVLGEVYTLSGRVRTLQRGVSLNGHVQAEEVDLGQWIFSQDEDEEEGAAREGYDSSFALQRLISAFPSSQLMFNFKRLKLLDFLFHDMKGRVATNEESIALEEAQGRLEVGEAAFEGYLDMNGGFWFAGGVDGADAGAVLSTLGFEEEIIEGPLFLQAGVDGRLTGRRAGDHEGNVELEIERGMIRRFPLLANVFSLLNVSQIFMGQLPDLSTEGMAFRKIRGSFALDNGVAHIDDFRIFSEALGVTAIGDLDLMRMETDLKVGVQPFVGLDRLVNVIPVVRHYIAGPDGSVLATYFIVDGPLSNPNVRAIPFRSFGEGVLGVFKRLLQNPFRDLGPPGELPPPLQEETQPPW